MNPTGSNITNLFPSVLSGPRASVDRSVRLEAFNPVAGSQRTNFNRLETKVNGSHVNAVLQCLATARDPSYLKNQLGTAYIGATKSFDHLDSEDILQNIETTLNSNQEEQVNLVAELFKILILLQEPNEPYSMIPINPTALYHMVRVHSEETDPADCLELFLNQLAMRYPRPLPLDDEAIESRLPRNHHIQQAFGIRERIQLTCQETDYCTTHPRYTEENAWMLQVGVGHNDESESMTTLVRSTVTLDYQDEYYCSRCGKETKTSVLTTGITHLPEVLVINLDFPTNAYTDDTLKEFHVRLFDPRRYLDLKDCVFPQSNEQVMYSLQSLVTIAPPRSGNGFDYIALTRCGDTWHVCQPDGIKYWTPSLETDAEWIEFRRDWGIAKLLFYERVKTV